MARLPAGAELGALYLVLGGKSPTGLDYLQVGDHVMVHVGLHYLLPMRKLWRKVASALVIVLTCSLSLPPAMTSRTRDTTWGRALAGTITTLATGVSALGHWVISEAQTALQESARLVDPGQAHAVKPTPVKLVPAQPSGDCTNTPVTSRITTDTVWRACQPYVLTQLVSISGARLTIEPGAIIKFSGSGRFDVAAGGRLEIPATTERPVILTSLKDDTAGGDTNGDGNASTPVSGDWKGLTIAVGGEAVLSATSLRYARDVARRAIMNQGQLTLRQSETEATGTVYSNGALTIEEARLAEASPVIDSVGVLSVSGSWFRCADACINDRGTAPASVLDSTFDGQGTGTGISVTRSAVPLTGAIAGNTFRSLQRGLQITLTNSGITADAVVSGNHMEHVAEAAAMVKGTVNLDTTLPRWDLPYGINGSFRVMPGVTLRIQPGTVVKHWPTVRWSVDGNLVAEGSLEEGISFTSYRDDGAGGDSNGDGAGSLPAPGDWWSIRVGNTGSVMLDHVIVRYASGPAISVEGTLTVRRSAILDTDGPGICCAGNIGFIDSTLAGFRGTGLRSTGTVRVVNSRFEWTGNQTAVSAEDLRATVLNSVFQGDGMSTGHGIDVRVTGGRWSGGLEGNTFRDMKKAVRFSLSTGGGMDPSATLRGNRVDRVAEGTIELSLAFRVDSTLPVSNLPYGFLAFSVEEGVTLRVPPGTHFKGLMSGAVVVIRGSLLAEGKAARPIVFTSVKDDGVGGDSNGDGAATRPTGSDGPALNITKTGSATLRHAILRYGYLRATIFNEGRLDAQDIFFDRNHIAIGNNGGSLKVRYSRIRASYYGVLSYTEGGDVRYNYWGAPNGPRPDGDGARITRRDVNGVPIDWVDYIPYLTAPPVDGRHFGPVPWADLVNGVNMATGNWTQTVTDARVEGGRGTPVAMQRTYNSLDPSGGPFGRGWTFNWGFRLSDMGEAVLATFPTGQTARFLRHDDGTYESEDSIYETLAQQADGSWLVTDRAGMRYRFGSTGQLLEATDRNGNSVTLQYEGGRLASITDAAERQFTFAWNGNGQIAGVTDPAGQTWSYTYGRIRLTDEVFATVLETVTDPRGGGTSYIYDLQAHLRAIRNKVDDDRELVALRMEHDLTGRVTSQYDGANNRTQFAYDDYLRTTTVTEPLGAITIRKFDLAMRQIGLTDPLGHTESYAFDDDSNLIEQTDKNGQTTRFVYDERGNRLSRILPATPEGTPVTRWEYHPRWNVPVKMTDALNQETWYTYDDRGNLREVTNRRGKTTLMDYYPDGLLQSVTDPRHNVTTFTYDPFGNPRMRKDPAPFGYETEYEYDILGRLTKMTDPLGNVTSRTYLSTGELSALTDADGTTEYRYDLTGKTVQITDPRRTTLSRYDERGRLQREVRQLSEGVAAETGHTYDEAGRPQSDTDPMGNETLYAYDRGGRLEWVSFRAHGQSTPELRARYQYDGVGNRIAETDANGNRTEFRYDAAGNVRERLEPGSTNPASFTYDLLGRKRSETDATGVTSRYLYDEEGNLCEVRNGLDQVVVYAYDAVGNRISVTDQRNFTTSYQYDQMNRLMQETDPYNRSTRFGYDGAGNRSSVTDPDQNVTRFTYDAKGRIKSVTDPGPGAPQTRYDYDATGNLVRVTDALNRVREYPYDLGDRLVAESAPDPALPATEHTYDLLGNRLTTRDRNGGLTQYTYDHLSRRIGIEAPGGVQIRSQYDPNGNRIAMTDETGTVSYGYDGLNRLRSKRTPDGREIAYRYDDAGRLATTTGYDGVVFTRSYDRLTGRLESVTGPGSASVHFTYDEAGNRTRARYGNGVTGIYRYDRLNRVEQVEWRDAAGASLLSAGYHYDARGNLAQRSDGRGTTSYQYDERGRLTLASAPEAAYRYTYDLVGNRTNLAVSSSFSVDQTAYAYDASDRLTARTEPDGTVRTFLWDANGNQLSDGQIQFGYDGLNRLVRVALPAGKQVGYEYDGDGLISARTADGSTTRYYWDGSHPYLETAGDVSYRNLVVDGVPLLRESAAGPIWYLTDAHRDVVGLAGSDGRLIGGYAYDPYGNRAMGFGTPPEPGAGASNPFRYAGEQWDEETGLYFLRVRYYAPGLGRFVTQDTYNGSPWQPWTQNLYSYVGNNPVNYVDPTGHFACFQEIPDCAQAVKTTLTVIQGGGAAAARSSWLSWLGPVGVFLVVLLSPSTAGETNQDLIDHDLSKNTELKAALDADPDAFKKSLNDKHYRACQSEMAGEAAAYREDGKPFDHCQEVWDAQQGVLNRVNQMKDFLNDSRLFKPTRDLIQQRLGTYSRLLDASESFFRVGPSPVNPLSPYIPRGLSMPMW